jgi:hypothetical protein
MEQLPADQSRLMTDRRELLPGSAALLQKWRKGEMFRFGSFRRFGLTLDSQREGLDRLAAPPTTA